MVYKWKWNCSTLFYTRDFLDLIKIYLSIAYNYYELLHFKRITKHTFFVILCFTKRTFPYKRNSISSNASMLILCITLKDYYNEQVHMQCLRQKHLTKSGINDFITMTTNSMIIKLTLCSQKHVWTSLSNTIFSQ